MKGEQNGEEVRSGSEGSRWMQRKGREKMQGREWERKLKKLNEEGGGLKHRWLKKKRFIA